MAAIEMPSGLSLRYDDHIAFVRSRVQAAVESVPEDERWKQYYKEDVEELINSDYAIRRFLIEWSGREDGTVKQILSSLKWKKSMKLRDLRDHYFPSEMWFIGGVFLYEGDREGRMTIQVRLKTAVTTRELMHVVKQFLAYLSWKIDSAAGEDGYIVLVDMQDISFQNCNLEMARYLLELRDVFPNGLKQLIAIDCPLIARAAWNMVKYAIPADKRHIMQVISRSDVTKFIAPENLPTYLGGTCSRKFCGPSVVPLDSPTSIQFGITHLGMQEEKSRKLFKMYVPMLAEAERLDQGMISDLITPEADEIQTAIEAM